MEFMKASNSTNQNSWVDAYGDLNIIMRVWNFFEKVTFQVGEKVQLNFFFHRKPIDV